MTDRRPPDAPRAAAGRSAGELRLEQIEAVFRSAREADGAPVPDDLFRWGPLRIVERLGEGGTAEVYRAVDPRLDREVALKLARGLDTGGSATRAFLREARMLARVRHPNVLTVHGADVHDGRCGVWTDLIEGQTLAELVAQRGPLGATEAAAVAVDLCRALAAVHAAGLVHGDVKPANVMRQQGGRYLLMDFGAGATVAADGAALLRSGTPVAVAPEVLRGETATRSVDLYGLGVVLYHAVTGRYPVEGDTLDEIVDAHRRTAAVPLLDRRADLPADFVRAVERALAPRPEDRFASAGEMERAFGSTSAAPQRTGPPAASVTPRRTALGGVAAAGTLVLVGAVWWGLDRYLPEEGAGDRAEPGVRSQEILSTTPGSHRQPAVSPDGALIAFTSDASGTDQVWVMPTAGGEPRQVTFGTAASSPAWTRGGEVLFERAGDGLWTVASLGGEPRRITFSGSDPAASPTEDSLVFSDDGYLWLVSSDSGGTPRRIEGIPRGPHQLVPADPAFAPDGQGLVVFRQVDGPLGDLWIHRLDSGASRQLTFDRAPAGSPTWTPDGRHIVFWSERGGSRNLWLVEAEGGEPRPLTTGAGEDTDPAMLPGGGGLVFTNSRNRWRLVAWDPESGERRVLLDRRLGVYFPELSPDGRQLAFSHSAPDGSVHLFRLDLETATVQQVTGGEGTIHLHPRWDGDRLVHYGFPAPALRSLPVDGGPAEVVAAGWEWEWERSAAPSPSPDDDRVAFQDRRTGARSRTVVRNLATDEEVELPGPSIRRIHWLAGDRAVVGTTGASGATAGDIVRCETDGSGCTVLTTGTEPTLDPGRRRIYFQRASARPNHREIWSIGADGGDEQRIGEIGPLHLLGMVFDVTGDGRILYTEYEDGRDELWRIEFDGIGGG